MDPVAICDEDGEVTKRFEYSPFGETSFMEPDFGPDASPGDWNWLFHGEFRDLETGYYNYGYRYYNPTTGRWPSRDPIGEHGGFNVYAFVENCPVNRYDSHGLYTKVNQPAHLSNLLQATQKVFKMRDCGDFSAIIQWSFSRPVGNGAIMQLVKQTGIINYCDCHLTDRGSKPINVAYTEFWRVQNGRIIDSKGEDGFQGNELGCTWGHITYHTDATYIPGAQITLTPGLVAEAGPLPAHYGWRNINGSTVSNTIPRIVTFHWNCCSGKKKTKWKEGYL